MIAQALTHLDRADEALTTLASHIEEAAKRPGEYSPVNRVHAQALAAAGRFDEAGGVLRPFLALAAQPRADWMRLAASSVQPESAAVAWLEHAASTIDPASFDERIALAMAWSTLAQNSGNASHLEASRAILDRLEADPSITAERMLTIAMAAEHSKNFEAAEKRYRRALEMDANLHVAKNNLAMILVRRGKSLDEAIQLATEATAAEPQNKNYIDTLAQAQAALNVGEPASANL
jgi:tetratricopeptide (TPR) repeat protein